MQRWGSNPLPLTILVTGVALLGPAVSSNSAGSVARGLPSLLPLSLQIHDNGGHPSRTPYLPGKKLTTSNNNNDDDTRTLHPQLVRWYVLPGCEHPECPQAQTMHVN